MICSPPKAACQWQTVNGLHCTAYTAPPSALPPAAPTPPTTHWPVSASRVGRPCLECIRFGRRASPQRLPIAAALAASSYHPAATRASGSPDAAATAAGTGLQAVWPAALPCCGARHSAACRACARSAALRCGAGWRLRCASGNRHS